MRLLRSLVMLMLFSAPALAEDWPGWLGPRRDGSSKAKIKPWQGDLEVAWKKAVGPGHSSPIVADGKLFLHTQVAGSEAEEVTAYDVKSGKKLWAKSYPRAKFASPFGTGPQATPAISGGKLYSFGATGLLTCFAVDKGKQLWQVDTQKEFSPPPLTFGTACSPLIEGDNVVLDIGGKGASVVAFAKETGKVVWKNLDDKACYASGIATGKGENRQLLFLTQKGLHGLAPKDGKSLWEFGFVDGLNESSMTPVVADDTILISSITNGMVGLKAEKGADGWKVTQRWKNPKLSCYFSTPIPVGKKYVYAVTGTILFPTSTLHCIDVETGKPTWSKTKVGKYHAALLRTGDNKLLMLSDLGELVLIDPNPKEFTELARTKFKTKEQLWAHPAVSNGLLYYRDDRELFCLKLPK